MKLLTTWRWQDVHMQHIGSWQKLLTRKYSHCFVCLCLAAIQQNNNDKNTQQPNVPGNTKHARHRRIQVIKAAFLFSQLCLFEAPKHSEREPFENPNFITQKSCIVMSGNGTQREHFLQGRLVISFYEDANVTRKETTSKIGDLFAAV